MLGGCSRTAGNEPVFAMNDRLEVGPLVYTVFDADWRDHLPGGKNPKNKFLIIRLSITNSGGRSITVPLLEVMNEKGDSAHEYVEVEGLEEWMGLLRPIEPAQTEIGRIVFDVPAGVHRLRLTDGGEAGHEKTALVEIPFRLGASPPSP